MTCCRKAISATSRLFLVMRMVRMFSPIPNPCSSRCETVMRTVLTNDGLKKLLGLLVAWRLLLKPTERFVPVAKPWLYEKFPAPELLCDVSRPVTIALEVLWVLCSSCRVPVSDGSNCGVEGPPPSVDVTIPPEPLPAPPAPALVPPAPPPEAPVEPLPVPPGVPETTPRLTPRADAPALVRRTSVSAIERL